jgi:hypothetical protein
MATLHWVMLHGETDVTKLAAVKLTMEFAPLAQITAMLESGQPIPDAVIDVVATSKPSLDAGKPKKLNGNP